MIGANGIEKVIEMTLKPFQEDRFAKSVASVRELTEKLYELKFFEDKK